MTGSREGSGSEGKAAGHKADPEVTEGSEGQERNGP